MRATKKEFNDAVHKIAETLKKEYRPAKIILFGSASRGEADKDSDIDMLIIKETRKPYGQRWMTVGRLTRDLKRSIPFEPIILTPKELQKAIDSEDLFISEILGNGKVLYDKAA